MPPQARLQRALSEKQVLRAYQLNRTRNPKQLTNPRASDLVALQRDFHARSVAARPYWACVITSLQRGIHSLGPYLPAGQQYTSTRGGGSHGGCRAAAHGKHVVPARAGDRSHLGLVSWLEWAWRWQAHLLPRHMERGLREVRFLAHSWEVGKPGFRRGSVLPRPLLFKRRSVGSHCSCLDLPVPK